jgi:hypothetical protein
VEAQVGQPDNVQDATRIGTCCHQIQAECLTDPEIDLQSYLGRKMLFWIHPESDSNGEDWESAFGDLETKIEPGLEFIAEVKVTQEMLDAVSVALAFIRNVHAMKGGLLEIEQRVPIDHLTGETDASGTSDVTLIGEDWIHVFDSKYGRGKVTAYEVVEPAHLDILSNEPVPEKVRPNLQMACYASGSMRKFAMLGDFKHVTMTIVQPFIQHVSEYTCTIDELRETEDFLRAKAIETRTNPVFAPSEDACHFCRANGNCAAQDKFLLEQAVIGFDDVATAKPKHVSDLQLGDKYALVGMISDWIKAVSERVYGNLREGLPVTRSDGLSYKLVAGKKGNREWQDEEVALATLKKMRLKDEELFTRKLKTPTQLDYLGKAPKVKKGQPPIPPVLGPTQWNRVLSLVTQSEGKPTIALSTDPRPAVAAATDGFDDVGPADNADLF